MDRHYPPLTWRDVDTECQRNGTDFDIQCRRMGLDPKKVRAEKAAYFQRRELGHQVRKGESDN
jgi:hypothetical protein